MCNVQNKHLWKSISGKGAASLLMHFCVSLTLFCRNIRSGRKKPRTFPCLGSTSAWWTGSTPSAASSSTPHRSCAPRSSCHTWKRSKTLARTVRMTDMAGMEVPKAYTSAVGRVRTFQECSAVQVVAWQRKHLNTQPVGFLTHLCDMCPAEADWQTTQPPVPALSCQLRAEFMLMTANCDALSGSVCLCFLQTKWE